MRSILPRPVLSDPIPGRTISLRDGDVPPLRSALSVVPGAGRDMAEPAALRRLLVISNGHGEDSIAAEIVRRMPPGFIVEAYPTLGSGAAYEGVCAVVGPRAALLSEGSRVAKGSLRRDLAGGGLATIPPGLAFLRRVSRVYDRVMVVGDLVGVAGCWLAGIRNVTYLDVYRTGFGRGYAAPERWLIRRTCGTVFCRSPELAASLARTGIDARFAGNVMMDTVPFGNYSAATRRRRATAVTLLPGSRQSTLENFALQVAALRRLPPDLTPDVFLAAAGSIPAEAFAQSAGLRFAGPMSGEAADLGTLSDDALTVHVAGGAAGNLIAASDVVLSQAGTATIQALGLGKPVISFTSPRDRPSRTRDESALFGAARVLSPANPEAVAAALAALLGNAEERKRLGAIGVERVGQSGAVDAVIARLREPQAA